MLRIFRKIQLLRTDPLPENSRKLSGSSGLFRLRVGHYRVLYGVDKVSGIITILSVLHRKEAYRNL
jgi:mRNA interferase RelE/StbE